MAYTRMKPLIIQSKKHLKIPNQCEEDFYYINNLQIFDYENLANLIEATSHHNWRFKSFARDLLKSLSEDQKYKEIITNLQDMQKE